MSEPSSILVVEDHSDIVEILQYTLEKEGFSLTVAKDGEEGFHKARRELPFLILLDLMLPKMGGLEVCRLLKQKQETQGIPIIMLTAKGEETDIISGLNLGADDYMTKPFSPKELVARIKAVLRRHKPVHEKGVDQVLKLGDLVLDPHRHEVHLKDETLMLTLSEFRILATLLSQPGRVFTRDQLIEKVHGPDIVIVDRNIDVHIASLRKKLKDHGSVIMTIRGVGYRCKEAV